MLPRAETLDFFIAGIPGTGGNRVCLPGERALRRTFH